MTGLSRVVTRCIAVLALTACVSGPAPTDLARAQLAPHGALRIGVNYGNPVVAQRDASGGPPRGVGPALGRELARRLGVPIAYVEYNTAATMADAANADAWDVAFLAIDPSRAAQIDFTAAYVQAESTYLVRRDSPYRNVADLDRDGIRIAVGEGTAYALYLARTLRHATLLKAPTSPAAVALFEAARLDAAAGVRNPLLAAARQDASLRVLEDSFMVTGQAAGVRKGRAAAATYLAAFIEEAKASGFVARALRDSGVTDATVAPPAPVRRAAEAFNAEGSR